MPMPPLPGCPMKVAVVGAGVIGVTTAYELTQDGHEVTVFERCATTAEGASFANGGLLAPEWMAAQASVNWGKSRPSGLRRWWPGARRAESRAQADPGPDLLNLARYGAERLDGLCDRLQLAVDSHQGMMVVWRDPRDSARAEDLHMRLRGLGSECHLMPADQARALELALNLDTALQGSLVMPDAWSVNCRQFALLLRARAQQEGCRFEFGNPVVQMQPGQGIRLACEKNAGGSDRFDQVVLCTGADTDVLLAAAGVRMPLETWQGYSLSAAVREPLDAPVAVVHDLRHGVSIARMGQRVRVSGPLSRHERGDRQEQAFKHLYKVLDDWFPGSIRHGQAGGVQEWSTRVSATPDGLPAIGSTAVPGLWVNTGHGMHGWVMACGSARLLADQMAGTPAALSAATYDPRRWSA